MTITIDIMFIYGFVTMWLLKGLFTWFMALYNGLIFGNFWSFILNTFLCIILWPIVDFIEYND